LPAIIRAGAIVTTTLLDPTGERSPALRPRAARLPSLAGQVIALLDISKPRGNVFLDRLATVLAARGATVRRYAKPTFTKPAPADLRRQIASECNAVIEALAD
jgi:hypothetical protein